MKKRLLSLFLVFTMAVSMLPLSALAEDAGAEETKEPQTEAVCPETEPDEAVYTPDETADDTPAGAEEAEAEAREQKAYLAAPKAEGRCGEHVTWVLYNNGELLISGTGRMYNNSQGKASWTGYNKDITSVFIKSGVTWVGTYAFSECTKLADIFIPSSVTGFGSGAFQNCTSLEAITLPSYSKDIYSYLFYGCTSLTTVTIPSTVKNIERYAFDGCSSLTDVYYYGSTEEWADITISSFNTPLLNAAKHYYSGSCGESAAWRYDPSGGSLSISGTGPMDDYSTGGAPWTEYRDDIKSVKISDVTRVGNYAFFSCKNLIAVDISSSVTELGSGVFRDCTSLEAITLPSYLTDLRNHLFYGCTSLATVTITSTIQYIRLYTFNGCTSLTDVYYYGTAEEWAGITISSFNTPLLNAAKHYCSGSCGVSAVWRYDPFGGSLSISGAGAMDGYSQGGAPWAEYSGNITSVTIDSGITEVGTGAFRGCTSLESVTLSPNMTAISNSLFYDCTSLTSVVIPSGVTQIGQTAFFSCTMLESICIPKSVTTVSYRAFLNCTSLKLVFYAGTETDWANIRFSSGNDNLSDAGRFYECITGGFCGYKWENLIWKLDKYGALTISGSGYMCDMETLTGECGGPWSKYAKQIKTVIIEEGVTLISNYAFKGLSFTSVSFPDGLLFIDSHAFEHCTGLTEIALPSSITIIGAYAFYGCSNLTTVVIEPSKFITIDCFAFAECSELTILSLPERADIYKSAFGTPDHPLTIYYPGSDPSNIHYYTNASSNAEQIPTTQTLFFQGIDVTWYLNRSIGLTTWDLSEDGVLTISGKGGMRSYYNPNDRSNAPWINNWDRITSIVINEGITYIGEYAFQGCGHAVSVTIPKSAKTIGTNAFQWCIGLETVTIPEGVNAIGRFAFESCTALSTVSLPASLTELSPAAFSGCTGLKAFTVAPGSKTFSSSDGILYKKQADGLMLYLCPAGISGSVVIPSGVTAIGDAAFRNCTGLTSVAIPASVTEISSLAFTGCTGLQSISVAQGNAKFSTADGILFERGSDGLTVKKCPVNKTGKVILPGTVTAIDDEAFCDCTGLTSVTLPESVAVIGSKAFQNCTSLTSLHIPAGTTTIYYDAFDGCTGLKSLTVSPDNEVFTAIDNILYAHSGEEFVLFRCPPFISGDIVLPSGVDWCCAGAFSDCPLITSVILPAGIQDVSTDMFNNCTGLTSVTIPDSVKRIGSYAFMGCTALTDVYFVGTREQWQKISFESNDSELQNAAKHYIPVGDMDRDGSLTLKDVSALFRWWNGKAGSFTDAENCDVNGDGTVDLRDAAALYRKI